MEEKKQIEMTTTTRRNEKESCIYLGDGTKINIIEDEKSILLFLPYKNKTISLYASDSDAYGLQVRTQDEAYLYEVKLLDKVDLRPEPNYMPDDYPEDDDQFMND